MREEENFVLIFSFSLLIMLGCKPDFEIIMSKSLLKSVSISLMSAL